MGICWGARHYCGGGVCAIDEPLGQPRGGSELDTRGSAVTEPDASEAVRAHLARVATSAGFATAGRLAPFLTFVVERTLVGEPVKESLVGVEVFGRAPDYDPRLDPIVRVEARRLRSRLAEYYAGPGANDAIVIEVPKGTYAPVFRTREPPTTTPAGSTTAAGSTACRVHRCRVHRCRVHRCRVHRCRRRHAGHRCGSREATRA